ncbi:uncharacterized protein F4807DRAFT_57885 [Annulohypoxylon truncatum]|uniref:uncharacterized protein n=1 Tax=Annulohypoxylon truncatum TaxID=327061 RepID=UPI0020080160|nr:uncharacterized protein F4807DRAFT_57885 [Annulohypoxylon truncatum]KAI1210750.1 hypothetical protein F4807DRAFT_57885 [Annulohypoxylon truncatum]
MRLAGVIVAAALPAVLAAQQRVLTHSTSMKIEDAPGSVASTPVLVNSSDSLARPSKPLTTVAAEKPALEASVMGLIVFSAAGLYLL